MRKYVAIMVTPFVPPSIAYDETCQAREPAHITMWNYFCYQVLCNEPILKVFFFWLSKTKNKQTNKTKMRNKGQKYNQKEFLFSALFPPKIPQLLFFVLSQTIPEINCSFLALFSCDFHSIIWQLILLFEICWSCNINLWGLKAPLFG